METELGHEAAIRLVAAAFSFNGRRSETADPA